MNDAPTGVVTIAGGTTPGATLTASNTLADADGPVPLLISYQWLRDGSAIAGAIGGTYVLTQADIGKSISVQAAYTDAFGQAEAVISAATSPVQAIITVAAYRAAIEPFPAGTTLADHSGALATLTPGEISKLATSGISVVDAADDVLTFSAAQVRALNNVVLGGPVAVTLLDSGAAISNLTVAELSGLAGKGIDAIDASDNTLDSHAGAVHRARSCGLDASDQITIADTGGALRGLSVAALQGLAGKGVDGLDATDNALTLCTRSTGASAPSPLPPQMSSPSLERRDATQ